MSASAPATRDEADEARDEKSAAIVDAAKKTFLARGFDGASMDAIALAAGVSKRTVYSRFRSKEELFAAVITDACKRILPVEIDAGDETPLETFLTNLAHRLLDVTLEPDALALHRITTFEAARTPALGKTFMEHGARRLVRAVAPYIERQVALGRLRPLDVGEAMWRFATLVREPLETQMLMGEPPEDFEAAVDDQARKGVADFLLLFSPDRRD